MEPHRIWHDPVVEIYGNLITPGVRCAAEAYDLGNRRWYQLNVDSAINDDEWFSCTVSRHIKEYYSQNQAPPPWNTINTTASGSPVTFETKPESQVARRIRNKFDYGGGPDDRLPTISIDELRDKTYLSRAADYCSWNSIKCVFKRIEFDPDVESLELEIRIREDLIRNIGKIGTPGDINQEMVARFHAIPIFAVVTDGQPKSRNVIGFIMPFWGDSLEILDKKSPNKSLKITEKQLRDLTRGVSNLHQAGIHHRDIRFWNVVLSEHDNRLILIDMGTEGPDYDGDAKALGRLLVWCLEHSTCLNNNPDVKARIEAANRHLIREDFDAAVKVLST